MLVGVRVRNGVLVLVGVGVAVGVTVGVEVGVSIGVGVEVRVGSSGPQVISPPVTANSNHGAEVCGLSFAMSAPVPPVQSCTSKYPEPPVHCQPASTKSLSPVANENAGSRQDGALGL